MQMKSEQNCETFAEKEGKIYGKVCDTKVNKQMNEQ